ncbi:hypothetical protein ADN01_02100 [Levilinea saccharolytica]|uniref:Uncharacterized protein n=1 Tax=Levilinea saccharolytica TaxID=229921 RepID=A0A0P6Z1H6_9CHLR|nr:hypothetical protein ADN01_02100 [Levilinea saccharolytica]
MKISELNQGRKTDDVFLSDPNYFSALPGSPFAYWVNNQIIGLFSKLPSLQKAGYSIQIGASSHSDFRFLRLTWEIPRFYKITSGKWINFAKGGEYSPYYYDIHLCINWNNKAQEIKEFISKQYPYLNGETDWLLHPESSYFRPGLTWPRRTNRFSVRCLPSNCIFADKGPAAFCQNDNPDDLLALLAVMNSSSFHNLVRILVAGTELAQSFEVGLIQQIPIPLNLSTAKKELAQYAYQAFEIIRQPYLDDETTNIFCFPGLIRTVHIGSSLNDQMNVIQQQENEARSKLLKLQQRINSLVEDLYGIPNLSGDGGIINGPSDENADGESETTFSASKPTSLVSDLVMWCIGVAFGRWDVRLSHNKELLPKIPGPFDPLPELSPGMLQTIENKNISSRNGPKEYPLRIPWLGILVDDKGHVDDIEQRIREVLLYVWQKNHESIEQEICQFLEVRSLRLFIQKPNLFFAFHLKRYSKSRRVAPIYWPLSTPSGSYTLWLYYHRLNDQTLYTCVNDFVDPKLKQVSEEAARLRLKKGRSAADEKELERLTDFERELRDFREELLRVAKFWKPNLNDGVEITAAPLWKLFQYKPWQKRLKETWQKLEAGEYDWAHLAYSIWPERVREKCKTDKSLAIAHDLEELYVEPEKPLKKGKPKKRAADEETEGWFDED